MAVEEVSDRATLVLVKAPRSSAAAGGHQTVGSSVLPASEAAALAFSPTS
jgi:hypothetical protein